MPLPLWRRLLPYLLIVVIVFFLDQLSKAVIIQQLNYADVVPVIPGFNIVLAFNNGVAFSQLQGVPGGRWLLSSLAIVVIVFLGVWLKKSVVANQRITPLALSCVLAGALGNVTDRMRLGHVVDFLDVYWRQYHWPAFNLADSAICLGVAFMIWGMWREPQPT